MRLRKLYRITSPIFGLSNLEREKIKSTEKEVKLRRGPDGGSIKGVLLFSNEVSGPLNPIKEKLNSICRDFGASAAVILLAPSPPPVRLCPQGIY